MWERTRLNETREGEEETQRAACKLVWLDPHPVFIMDTCACVCVSALERGVVNQREREGERLSFCPLNRERDRARCTSR